MRYKYRVTFTTVSDVLKFKSVYHISDMSVLPSQKGSYVYFQDIELALDLSQIKTIKIDGAKYKMQPYIM